MPRTPGFAFGSTHHDFVILSEAKDLLLVLGASKFWRVQLSRWVLSKLSSLNKNVISSEVRRKPNAVERPCVFLEAGSFP